jgi:hypothetical protein
MNVEEPSFAMQVRNRVERIIRYLSINGFVNKALIRGQELIIDELIDLDNLLGEQQILFENKKKEESKIVTDNKGKIPIDDDIKRNIKEIQKEAKIINIGIEQIRNAKWLFRYIGDGIAWRAFSYDRKIIGVLGAKEPVSFSSKKEGFTNEISYFKNICRKGSRWLPILHDITNCLRTNDISIFYNGYLVEIAEIKTKNGKVILLHEVEKEVSEDPRVSRQIAWFRKIKIFLETGDLGMLQSKLAGGRYIQKIIPLCYHFESIRDAITNSRINGVGCHEPEHGQLFIAINNSITTLEQSISELKNKYPHIFESPYIIQSMGSGGTYHHDLIPITGMDLPSKDIINVLFNEVLVFTAINYSCLIDQFKNRGIELNIYYDEKRRLHLLTMSNGFTGEIKDRLWDRVIKEGLGIISLIDLIKGIEEDYKNPIINYDQLGT